MVGAPRFELGTSWSRTKRATRLRYAPEKLADKRRKASPRTFPIPIGTRYQATLRPGVKDSDK